MTRLIGASATMVALGLSVAGLLMLLIGIRKERAELIRAGYAALYVNFGLMITANLAMVWALVTNDFSVSYVAQVGSRSTPILMFSSDGLLKLSRAWLAPRPSK